MSEDLDELTESYLDRAIEEWLEEGDPETCDEGGWTASETCQRCPSAEFCRDAFRQMIKEIEREK